MFMLTVFLILNKNKHFQITVFIAIFISPSKKMFVQEKTNGSIETLGKVKLQHYIIVDNKAKTRIRVRKHGFFVYCYGWYASMGGWNGLLTPQMSGLALYSHENHVILPRNCLGSGTAGFCTPAAGSTSS